MTEPDPARPDGGAAAVGVGWRSLLFVPAHLQKLIDKAPQRGADAYILDLEDGVPASQKDLARQMLTTSVAAVVSGGAAAMVRINRPDKEAASDLEAAICAQVSALVLPKVESAAEIEALDGIVSDLEKRRGLRTGQTCFLAQIESVAALPQLDAIAAASPRMLAMSLGTEDFSASVGMIPSPENLFAPSQQILFACRRQGIIPLGFPASIADYSDLNQFRATIVRARQMGFRGAMCIHPNQVAIQNEAFLPDAGELDEARAIVDAYEAAVAAGRGAVELNGKMVDLPVVERARETLQQSEREFR